MHYIYLFLQYFSDYHKNQPVSIDVIMQYKTSNCDTHKSFIKFCNSHDGKAYISFFDGMFIKIV